MFANLGAVLVARLPQDVVAARVGLGRRRGSALPGMEQHNCALHLELLDRGVGDLMGGLAQALGSED